MKEFLRTETCLTETESNLVFNVNLRIKKKTKKEIWSNLLNGFCKRELVTLRQVSCSLNTNLAAMLFLVLGWAELLWKISPPHCQSLASQKQTDNRNNYVIGKIIMLYMDIFCTQKWFAEFQNRVYSTQKKCSCTVGDKWAVGLRRGCGRLPSSQTLSKHCPGQATPRPTNQSTQLKLWRQSLLMSRICLPQEMHFPGLLPHAFFIFRGTKQFRNYLIVSLIKHQLIPVQISLLSFQATLQAKFLSALPLSHVS